MSRTLSNRYYTVKSLLLLSTLLIAACSQPFTVSLNSQSVFDPNNRLPNKQTVNPDLQGCINLAMRQQLVEAAEQLTVLSCSSSEITSLANIGSLTQLRFLDLGSNNVINITPLESLLLLGGLNLNDNAIRDIAVLFNLPSLVTVSLEGNLDIPCSQIETLTTQLGSNLTPPKSCRN